MVLAEPLGHAVLLGTLSSTTMVVLSKKEKMAEKAVEVGAGRELRERPWCREELLSLNSVAYRKVGTMGTESQ